MSILKYHLKLSKWLNFSVSVLGIACMFAMQMALTDSCKTSTSLLQIIIFSITSLLAFAALTEQHDNFLFTELQPPPESDENNQDQCLYRILCCGRPRAWFFSRKRINGQISDESVAEQEEKAEKEEECCVRTCNRKNIAWTGRYTLLIILVILFAMATELCQWDLG